MQQTFHHWASWSVLYTQCFAFDLSKLWCTRFALKRQNMSTTKKYTELVCRQVEIWTSTFCACSRTPVCQHAACSSIASTVFYLPNLCLTSPRVLSHQGSAMVRQNTWHAWVFRLEFAVMNRGINWRHHYERRSSRRVHRTCIMSIGSESLRHAIVQLRLIAFHSKRFFDMSWNGRVFLQAKQRCRFPNHNTVGKVASTRTTAV